MNTIVAVLTFAALPLSSAFAQTTERFSVASSGLQGNHHAQAPSISSDGRFIAFESEASNLVPGDTNSSSDIFVHDRQTGQTTLESVDSGGLQGNHDSTYPSLSANGRFVAFRSAASNLVSGDTNNTADVFVRDRQTGHTTRVNVSSGGIQAISSVSGPLEISSDGRFVAFQTSASNLVPGDTNGSNDVFVHDRHTGMTMRVSVDSGGLQGDSNSINPGISSDGRYVAFESRASNLVPGDTNNESDVFVHDRQTGLTTRVSVSSGGLQGTNESYWPRLSSDGGVVTFWSSASNLVPGDTNLHDDIFVHDRRTALTTRVSMDSSGAQGNDDSYVPDISGDGRFVTFFSDASNLVPGDTNRRWDVFVHDRQTGLTTRVSVDSGGFQANNRSYDPRVSYDGRFIVFGSQASNLVPNDTNQQQDVFVHDRQTVAPTLVIQGSCPGPMILTLGTVTPQGGVAFAFGAAGSFTLTSSVCAGTILDIANPLLGPVIRASWLGTIVAGYPTTHAMCGRTIQALDIQTCKTSNTVVL